MATKLKWGYDPSILLSDPIPPPLHGVNPRTIFGSVWWENTRKDAIAANAYHCKACGVWKMNAACHQWLEVHESYSVDYVSLRSYFDGVLPLCHFCHAYIHRARLAVLLENRMIPQGKYASIIQHGDSVLQSRGLKRLPYRPPSDIDKTWSRWRLVLDGVEYPPVYASMTDWCNSLRGTYGTARH